MNLIESKVYVGLPHSVNIIDNVIYDIDKRKTVVNGKPHKSASLLPNEKLSAKINTNFIGLLKDSDVPIYEKQVVECDPLPEGYDIYVVSVVYAKAYSQLYGYNEKLYTVADPVYSSDGRTIIGQRGICRAL